MVRNAGDGTLTVIPASTVSLAMAGIKASLPTTTLNAGIGVSDVELIDTTGSGTLDIVVTNKLTGLVSVLHNLGGGNFAPPVPYRAGAGLAGVDTSTGTAIVTSQELTSSVAAGTFTPGGSTGLLTVNPGSNTLGLLAGLGEGRFANPVNVQTAASRPGRPRRRFQQRRHPGHRGAHGRYGGHLPRATQGRLRPARLLQRRPRTHRPDRRRALLRWQPRPAHRRRVWRRPGTRRPRRRHVPAAPRRRQAPWPWPWLT